MLAFFVLAMLHNPEVQRCAQKHIDDIVGRQRMPTMDDQRNLPYIQALVKELLRWQPVTPMGIAHRCTEVRTVSLGRRGPLRLTHTRR